MHAKGGTVPLTITYRKVTKKPEIKRTRRFIGWRNIVRNIAIKAIEFVEEICYETEREVLDGGEQRAVHWALEVEDPWGDNDRSELIAVRLPDKPASCASLEIITIDDGEQPITTDEVVIPERSEAETARQEVVRQRLREQLLREATASTNKQPN